MSESAQISGVHPDHELLERFMRNDVPGSEKRRVVRHLLAGCPLCVSVTRAIWDLAGGRPAFAGLLDADSGVLPPLVQIPGVPDISETPELPAATPGERLDLLRLEASLAAERGRFEEADRLLAGAAETWRAAGELPLAGSVLVERGTLHATAGHYESAIELLGDGADLLADPTLLAASLHRRAELLFEVGRGEEAREVAGSLLALYERPAAGARHSPHADPIGLLRLRWLLGKIEEDEATLLQVREGLLAAGLGLAAAQISLDLAVLYARKGCWGEIRHLAAEIFPILKTRDLRREAMAGLLVFRRAVETESASLEFLVEVARYLLGSRRTRWGSS